MAPVALEGMGAAPSGKCGKERRSGTGAADLPGQRANPSRSRRAFPRGGAVRTEWSPRQRPGCQGCLLGLARPGEMAGDGTEGLGAGQRGWSGGQGPLVRVEEHVLLLHPDRRPPPRPPPAPPAGPAELPPARRARTQRGSFIFPARLFSKRGLKWEPCEGEHLLNIPLSGAWRGRRGATPPPALGVRGGAAPPQRDLPAPSWGWSQVTDRKRSSWNVQRWRIIKTLGLKTADLPLNQKPERLPSLASPPRALPPAAPFVPTAATLPRLTCGGGEGLTCALLLSWMKPAGSRGLPNPAAQLHPSWVPLQPPHGSDGNTRLGPSAHSTPGPSTSSWRAFRAWHWF